MKRSTPSNFWPSASALRGQLEQRVERDDRLAVAAPLADDARPHGVVQFRIVVLVPCVLSVELSSCPVASSLVRSRRSDVPGQPGQASDDASISSADPSTAPRRRRRPARSRSARRRGRGSRRSSRRSSPTLNEACTMSAGMKARVARAEDALLAVDPLLDRAGDDVDHLLLVGVLVEIVALAGREVHVDDGELLRAGVRRVAQPAELAPVEHLGLRSPLAITNLPAIAHPPSIASSHRRRRSP